MSFSSGIAGYAKRTGLRIDNAVVAVCAKASTEIIKKTPVDTGRARGNWYASIGTASIDTSETRSESEAINDAISTSMGASGKVFYFSNNLEYVRNLEYGGSTQAPRGMVRITVAQIKKDLGAFK
jgi:hypothetical protein